jgi:hypothetical protein
MLGKKNFEVPNHCPQRSLTDHPTNEETETLFSNLSELFSTIESFKKRVGVIGPRRFVSKLKKENGSKFRKSHLDIF